MSAVIWRITFGETRDERTLASGETLLLGRGKDSDISVPDPNLSRKHIALRNQDGIATVEDLESTNGSFLHKKKIKVATLAPGDIVECGDTKIEYAGATGEEGDSTLGGERFGDFEIAGMLGHGGLGVVIRAVHTPTGREMAVKILDTQFNDQPDIIKRFEREARAGRSIQNEHFIRLFDFGRAEGAYYISMEYYPSKDLNVLIEENGRIPAARLVPIVRQVLEALEWAHNAGYVHRDIKPHNILVGEDGFVKIADLGLTKKVKSEGASMVTMDGDILGTPEYMPPEQINSSRDVDRRADIYAVGATMYAALLGSPPFDGENAFAIVEQVLSRPPQPLAERGVTVPEWLWNVIEKSMRKNPDERFRTCSEMLAAFQN